MTTRKLLSLIDPQTPLYSRQLICDAVRQHVWSILGYHPLPCQPAWRIAIVVRSKTHG
jgi:hypothetical protein